MDALNLACVLLAAQSVVDLHVQLPGGPTEQDKWNHCQKQHFLVREFVYWCRVETLDTDWRHKCRWATAAQEADQLEMFWRSMMHAANWDNTLPRRLYWLDRARSMMGPGEGQRRWWSQEFPPAIPYWRLAEHTSQGTTP